MEPILFSNDSWGAHYVFWLAPSILSFDVVCVDAGTSSLLQKNKQTATKKILNFTFE